MRLLLLDYDGRRLPLHHLARLCDIVQRTVVGVWERRSPGGRGWHRVVALDPPPQSAWEVLALQLILGSDQWREAHNFNRVRARLRRAPWNVLYTKERGAA